MDLIQGTTEIQMNLPWIVFQQKKEYNKEYLRNILTVTVRLYDPILIIIFLRANTTIDCKLFEVSWGKVIMVKKIFHFLWHPY